MFWRPKKPFFQVDMNGDSSKKIIENLNNDNIPWYLFYMYKKN